MSPRLAFAAACVALLALPLLPVWGVEVPLLVDLPEQLAVAKLFAESVLGESALDTEVSGYLGYRFFPLLAAAGLGVFAALGADPARLPTALTGALVLLHGGLILAALKPWTRARGVDASWSLALFPLTAVYAGAFYIGFVNYFPAVPFLILAISLAETWYASGRAAALAGCAGALALVYVCHPFAFAFWTAWAGCRLAVLLALRRPLAWPRIAALGAASALVVVYHLAAAPGAIGLVQNPAPQAPIFVTLRYWLEHRVLPFATGDFFALERNAASTLYALSMLGLVLASLAHLVRTRSASAAPAQLLLTALLLCLACSLPNEAAIPVPPGIWLAYDLRFASTAPAILIACTCIYLFDADALHRPPRRRAIGALGVALAAVCVLQLSESRQWFVRFDAFARPQMPEIARGADRVRGRFRSRYHENGSYIRHYRCLFADDCVPSRSWFVRANDLGLYPVRIVR